MYRATHILRFTTWIVLLCCLPACAETGGQLGGTFSDPDHWFTMQLEKTPPPDAKVLNPTLLKLELPATYDDVWRAVQMTNTQTLLTTLKADKTAGVILAKQFEPGDSLYSHRCWVVYKINIWETGPERTAILILVKSHCTCNLTPWWARNAVIDEMCERGAGMSFFGGPLPTTAWFEFVKNNLYAMGAMQP